MVLVCFGFWWLGGFFGFVSLFGCFFCRKVLGVSSAQLPSLFKDHKVDSHS